MRNTVIVVQTRVDFRAELLTGLQALPMCIPTTPAEASDLNLDWRESFPESLDKRRIIVCPLRSARPRSVHKENNNSRMRCVTHWLLF
jgi:hypothetical protein